ncbi:hypothetical protein JTE90_006681 [Oedothorax gibbosus]|uniref:C2H2-type domain-containing protein n=1 Tax=Oedothorax gibbosus TaxID=931172 RepID=A0AAV6V1S4_9ARAC|nr:hypothetical protein JTE90_006681 [Oedothorax gibbosus]
MPRRKQGHSKDIATGGYLKKRTDPGIVVIQNESFKHLPTSNDLVFKIKKTVSSIVPLNEKTEREHIEVSKSLSEFKVISKQEINNNNLIKINQNEIKEQQTGKNQNISKSINSEYVQSEPSTIFNVSANNSVFVNGTRSEIEALSKNFSSSHNSVIKSNRNQVLNTPIANNRLPYVTVTSTVAHQSNDLFENAIKVSSETAAEMSGVTPTTNEGHLNNAESQQLNYRISTTENRSNHLKDAVNPVLEQNCQLPSSVYGSPASSVEKVLMGMQSIEKNSRDNLEKIGKVSFLQEILEKKSTSNKSVANVSEQRALPNIKSSFSNDLVIPSSKQPNSNFENRIESISQSKLKLNIPDGVNEDSNSSIVSTESFKSSKFPKITSPQILEQHISKIISENAAIVETLDPMWSRRFFKQTSQSNAGNSEGDSKKKSVRNIEDKSSGAISLDDPNKSKLHSALLGGNDRELLNNNKNTSIPSPNIPPPKERHFSQFNSLIATIPGTGITSKNTLSDEDTTNNAVKNLLSLKQGKVFTQSKPFTFDKDIYSQHPQNPEGSIIKDLLLKSKTQEELKMESEAENKTLSYSTSYGVSNQTEKPTSFFKCPNCSSEFPSKYNLDSHLNFCMSTSPLTFLRESTEKFRLKNTNAQSKPLSSSLDFRYKPKENAWDSSSKSDLASENANNGVGKILKQQLLMPRSPPMKRRKMSDTLFGGSAENLHYDNKNFPSNSFGNSDMLPYRSRSQSVHLFGGEVQFFDGSEKKKIKIKTPFSGAFSMFTNEVSNAPNNSKKSKLSGDLEVNKKDTSSLSGVIVNIAQPGHNSGATVHLSTEKLALLSTTAVSSNISDFNKKYPPMETDSILKFSKSNQSAFKPPCDQNNHSIQNLSYPYNVLPGPDTKSFTIPPNTSNFALNEFMSSSSPNELPSSTSKPFYSPIFSFDKRNFELTTTANSKEESTSTFPIVPTVLFTPSSPTRPSNDNELVPPATSISETTKKFLAPTRPTSLPLKKKPFTMVSSTLVSPETPRPKKSCVQLYLNGHAYTYLGLKCSTRSTYCSIYRPQPMFVPQETNPKLSMYSNWQVMPAKEELSGYTPGQMISLYSSKQKKEFEPITINSKVGEPLIFTHSSYWTYRSQDPPEKQNSNSYSDSSLEQSKDVQLPSENAQELVLSENSRSESVISSFGAKVDRVSQSTDESSLHVDTENTCSDGDPNNSDEEEDDDDEDDISESLTDSSQPKPPKRVKIFEGGFKSNEDYTYVRGRGRGKYVCEECGIRCKKPSMLKKHIRTHTDLRPYKCRHCSFAFKTKGNLTKHMKSKAHHKKCTELGIVPVPTTTDDSQVDEEALAKQIEKKKRQFSDGEDADDDEDEDSDESDDECESDASSMISSKQTSSTMANGHLRNSDSQDKLTADFFDEASKGNDSTQKALEQEAVRSLLNLSALGEPSQWSTSTGNLTDVTSSGETEDGSSVMRSEQFLLSTSQFPSHMSGSVITSRVKNLSDQWLSTETLGHRPRSYSADIPQSSGKDSLAKYKYLKTMNTDSPSQAPVDESTEFGGKETYARRYSISVAREARRPRILQPPDWIRTNPQKWLEGGETSDQPMDLSITRDLGKYKSMYSTGLPSPLMNMTTEENAPEANLSSGLDAFGESYQLKSLPVLSPQLLVDYEAGCENIGPEASLLPLSDEPNTFTSATQRPIYYVQDVPPADVANQKEAEVIEDPPSPDITDYAACSPVSPPTLEDSSYYYSQDNPAQTNTEEASPASRFRAEFIVPSSSSSGMEEGKCVCRICNKMFAKSSHLRLHVNIHYFERPFRCDNCAVSFRTKGHLQKHKRSVSHYNKVNMNLTFGTPTVDNPRPFKCGDCKIAFRIHGHLAKHLRSKMHIMKLECLGKLPFGMYAEMERSGISLNEIDTTDCNNSLESLQVMAQKLYQRDPRRMRWQGPEQISDTGCVIPVPTTSTAALIDSILPISEPLTSSFDSVLPSISTPVSTLAPVQPDNDDGKTELTEVDALTLASVFPESDASVLPLSRFIASQSTASLSIQEPLQRLEPAVENDASASLHRSCTCHLCGRLFKSAKFLQVHLYCDHSNWNPSSTSEAVPSNDAALSVAGSKEPICDLCGKQFPNQKSLQQHLLSHAQPRPFHPASKADLCNYNRFSYNRKCSQQTLLSSEILPKISLLYNSFWVLLVLIVQTLPLSPSQLSGSLQRRCSPPPPPHDNKLESLFLNVIIIRHLVMAPLAQTKHG